MHFLDELFRRSFGGCLQAAQEVLGMHRVGKSPTDCFQLARRMVRLVGTEGQRYEMDEWLKQTGFIDIPHRTGNLPASVDLKDLSTIDIEGPPGAAALVFATANSLQAFRRSRIKSDDRVVCFFAQLLDGIERFMQFETSKGNSDSVAMEGHLLEEGKYMAGCNKHLYFGGIVSEAETHYFDTTSMRLQRRRINRCSRQMPPKVIVDEDGIEKISQKHRCIGKDGNVEDTNANGKEMEGAGSNAVHAIKMTANDLMRCAWKTWQRQSGHDPESVKSSSKTNETEDRIAITRFLRASKSCVECPGRKEGGYDMNQAFWPFVKFAKKMDAAKQEQYTKEERAVADLFSKKEPDVSSKEVEEAEQAQNELDEAVIDRDEVYSCELTAAQLKKQEKKSKYPWDTRGDGNWAEKGLALLANVDSERAASRRRLQRGMRQAEEAADLYITASDKAKRVPRRRRAGWREIDAAIRSDMAAGGVGGGGAGAGGGSG